MVAGFVLDSLKISGDLPELPDFVKRSNSGRRLVGTYK